MHQLLGRANLVTLGRDKMNTQRFPGACWFWLLFVAGPLLVEPEYSQGQCVPQVFVGYQPLQNQTVLSGQPAIFFAGYGDLTNSLQTNSCYCVTNCTWSTNGFLVRPGPGVFLSFTNRTCTLVLSNAAQSLTVFCSAVSPCTSPSTSAQLTVLPFRVNSILLSGVNHDQIAVGFTAFSNRTYGVQGRAAAGSGVWSNIASIAAQPTNRLVWVTNSSPQVASSSFYRLVSPAAP
jgi:hypothetical protein